MYKQVVVSVNEFPLNHMLTCRYKYNIHVCSYCACNDPNLCLLCLWVTAMSKQLLSNFITIVHSSQMQTSETQL